MFTGIVQGTGTVAALRRAGRAARVTIRTPWALTGVARGDSIAVDGVCLTATAVLARRFSADVIPETLSRTTLGSLRAGDRVNLERSLAVGSPLGGHWVLGHADAVVRVLRVVRNGEDRRLVLELPAELSRYLAFKGSVALHGISLTVSRVAPGEFEVALIPETLRRTNLAGVRPGSRLNVEVDVLARYLERWQTEIPDANPAPRRPPSKRKPR